jgi:serine/threonine protein phosphatase PrpC
MTVVCAACGKISRDREFCDHCNADLQAVPDRLPPARCPLPELEGELTAAQQQALSRVENAIVIEAGEGQNWRVHWVPRAEYFAWQSLLQDRLDTELQILPPCQVHEVERGQWVFCPTSPTARNPWRDRTLAPDPVDRLRLLVADVESLANTLTELHRRELVWLTFDPAALEDGGVLPSGVDPSEPQPHLWRITNLDVRLFRSGECPSSLAFNAHYAPPEVCAFRAADIGPATDVYHLALFAYYWCAGLLPTGFSGAGLEAFEHRIPPLRPFAPDVPEGIIPAIQRGLAIDPRGRYATPDELVRALRARVDQVIQRRRFTAAMHWDAGKHSVPGRSKEALGKGNEDHCVLRVFSAPQAVLAAVADGISTCDIGSGALASLVAGIIVENRFDAGCSHGAFPEQVTTACQEGSRRILEWAIEKGYQHQLALGLDLMGTTLTVAWLEGRELSVANLGDSRTYLLAGDWVDQLTVDGDLGTELVARGTPPEQVQRMGAVGRALRSCVGGCTLNNGRVEVLPESCAPTVARWPVVPGDRIVLCSDGLIEEGFFLEPDDVAAILREHPGEPAAELARRLVAAANALQRPPSPTEPEGFGDNITCIVIKIEGDEEQGENPKSEIRNPKQTSNQNTE